MCVCGVVASWGALIWLKSVTGLKWIGSARRKYRDLRNLLINAWNLILFRLLLKGMCFFLPSICLFQLKCTCPLVKLNNAVWLVFSHVYCRIHMSLSHRRFHLFQAVYTFIIWVLNWNLTFWLNLVYYDLRKKFVKFCMAMANPYCLGSFLLICKLWHVNWGEALIF